MLKAIGFIIKISVFALLVLVLGHTVRWEGRTISDQVKTRLSQAERSPTATTVRKWSKDLAHDVKEGLEKKISSETLKAGSPSENTEEIRPSERQKLRALIRELNGSSAKN